ncbi:hypothetical protein N8873_07555 [Flavobacteriaceae bacterium]|nr:hypothetical protein [Flavobacteriaceae bacterium]
MGHAMLLCKNAINDNFAIINADDFYRRQAFQSMASFLKQTDSTTYNFGMIAYLLENTVSDYGFVSRGKCVLDSKNYLASVNEITQIEKSKEKLIYKDGQNNFKTIEGNTMVSMNFWGLTPKCFEFGQELFEQFLEENKSNSKAEYYLPSIVNELLKSGKATVKTLKSNAKWFGVTYSEDKPKVQLEINHL